MKSCQSAPKETAHVCCTTPINTNTKMTTLLICRQGRSLKRRRVNNNNNKTQKLEILAISSLRQVFQLLLWNLLNMMGTYVLLMQTPSMFFSWLPTTTRYQRYVAIFCMQTTSSVLRRSMPQIFCRDPTNFVVQASRGLTKMQHCCLVTSNLWNTSKSWSTFIPAKQSSSWMLLQMTQNNLRLLFSLATSFTRCLRATSTTQDSLLCSQTMPTEILLFETLHFLQASTSPSKSTTSSICHHGCLELFRHTFVCN